MAESERPTNWTQAGLTEETLRIILQLAYEYQEMWGRKITTHELRVALGQPGK